MDGQELRLPVAGGPPAQALGVPARVVETCLGLAWLLFGLGKALGPTGSTPASTSPLLLVGAVFGEAVVGLGLVLIRGRGIAWLAAAWPMALVLYGLAWEGWFRQPGCGCFGPVRVGLVGRQLVLAVTLVGAGYVALCYETVLERSRGHDT